MIGPGAERSHRLRSAVNALLTVCRSRLYSSLIGELPPSRALTNTFSVISEGRGRCDLLVHSRFNPCAVPAKPGHASASVLNPQSLLGSKCSGPSAQQSEWLLKEVAKMQQESRELGSAVSRIAAALHLEPRPAGRHTVFTLEETSCSDASNRVSEVTLYLPEGANAPGRVQVGSAELWSARLDLYQLRS